MKYDLSDGANAIKTPSSIKERGAARLRAAVANAGLCAGLCALSAGLGLNVGVGLAPAHAQPVARAVDSIFDAAQRAFEALPMAKRQEIQEGLIWSGHYKGGIDGEFGPMTMRAIQAYEARGRGARDGILSLQDIASLTSAANRQKAALGFRSVVDPRSGVKIGLPTKFLKRRNQNDGSIYEARDRGITVRTFEIPESAQSLADLYDQLRAPARGRRVSYRVLRNDFLVVSAIDRGRFYYTRVARGVRANTSANPGNKVNEMRMDGGALLRGYTLSISENQMRRRRPQMDILTIAISNSFEPFPRDGAQTVKSAKGGGVTVARRPDGLQPVKAESEILAGTALTVANDTYLTVLDPKACSAVRIGKAPARHIASDPATGLALYSAPVGGGQTLQGATTGSARAGADALVLFAELPSPGANRQISLTRGTFGEAAGKHHVKVIVPDSAPGGLALTSQGGVAGLIGTGSAGARKVAGPVPPLSRSMIAPSAAAAFLAKSGVSSSIFAGDPPAPGSAVPAASTQAKASPGTIAQTYARALAAVWCVKK
ncbi:MAG: peptidoglycan-binding protein [Hyphomicrobiales bacterium]|nr:peptidoglycan-binding protein [Hyphomicrobiales bacterium]